MGYTKNSEGLFSIRKMAIAAGLSYHKLFRAITLLRTIDAPSVRAGERYYYRPEDLAKVVKQYMALDKQTKGVK